MRLDVEIPKEMTWAEMGKYLSEVHKLFFWPSAPVFVQEAQKVEGCNWALALLWSGLRSQMWTTEAARKRWDFADLGGEYQTMRLGIAEVCKEFVKYSDTSMLVEGKALEKEWQRFYAYCLEKNQSGNDPGKVPPPPPQPEPKPKPKPEPEPKKPVLDKGKKMALWAAISLGISLLLKFLPPPWNLVGEGVLKVVSSILGIFE